ncbi:MAG: lspA [Alphaproteobacteria bacterium]|nr:lspA [Alphaproteobacteria bacterium]MDB5720366.1 lspA [Alphaproteobacteria bacterium]
MADAAEIVYVPAARFGKIRLIGLATALAVLILDQAAKWIVTYIFQLRERIEISLLPFFRLSWTENRGVSMGFLTTDSDLERWLLVGLTAAIAAFVAAWLWRERRRDDVVALGLVLGGALGNIIDRVRLGYVVDYADLHFGDIHPFLVFNVGDAAITIGVLLLVLRALLTRERKPPQKDE